MPPPFWCCVGRQKQMKKKRNIFLTALLVVAMLLTGGCGPKINSEQITKLDKADTGSDSNIPEEEQAEPLKEDNELPEDGIITTAQMKTISGEEGEYKFHGEDKYFRNHLYMDL